MKGRLDRLFPSLPAGRRDLWHGGQAGSCSEKENQQMHELQRCMKSEGMQHLKQVDSMQLLP